MKKSMHARFGQTGPHTKTRLDSASHRLNNKSNTNVRKPNSEVDRVSMVKGMVHVSPSIHNLGIPNPRVSCSQAERHQPSNHNTQYRVTRPVWIHNKGHEVLEEPLFLWNTKSSTGHRVLPSSARPWLISKAERSVNLAQPSRSGNHHLKT